MRGRQGLHRAAKSNNADEAEILVESCPRGIIVKVGSLVRQIVCKTLLNLGLDELAYEVTKSIFRELVTGFCFNK